jgi:hypothetical protein
LQSWIENVTNIHSQKKSSLLSAIQPQDLEKLMAEWPERMDEALTVEQVLRFYIDSATFCRFRLALKTIAAFGM